MNTPYKNISPVLAQDAAQAFGWQIEFRELNGGPHPVFIRAQPVLQDLMPWLSRTANETERRKFVLGRDAVAFVARTPIQRDDIVAIYGLEGALLAAQPASASY